ncbi:MAG TPA: DUF488 family protein [Polyangia bacterium]|jgi:uncharacterized protein YeaO (DUF488 family)|nr:DUF488 family protein [Polyangia bacterium]
MPLKTKRWNDPEDPDDGFRLLVCRIRPRGVAKADERWDEWWPDLGPSRPLLHAFRGKERATPLPWKEYRALDTQEMRQPRALLRLRALAQRLAAGDAITLLCASACTDPARCHRTVLAGLLTKPRAR